jgi:hypothetical protein
MLIFVLSAVFFLYSATRNLSSPARAARNGRVDVPGMPTVFCSALPQGQRQHLNSCMNEERRSRVGWIREYPKWTTEWLKSGAKLTSKC